MPIRRKLEPLVFRVRDTSNISFIEEHTDKQLIGNANHSSNINKQELQGSAVQA
jgi:hypothetical protein